MRQVRGALGSEAEARKWGHVPRLNKDQNGELNAETRAWQGKLKAKVIVGWESFGAHPPAICTFAENMYTRFSKGESLDDAFTHTRQVPTGHGLWYRDDGVRLIKNPGVPDYTGFTILTK